MRTLAVTVVLVVTAACSSGGGEASRIVRLDTAVGDPSRSDAPVAAPRGPLEPGNYVTATLRPEATFRVDGSWELVTESPVSIELRTQVGAQSYSIVKIVDIRRARLRVLDPPYASSPYNRSDLFRASHPLKGDYLDWLGVLPTLAIGPAERVDLAGLRGRRVSFVVDGGPDGTCSRVQGACLVVLLVSADSSVYTDERGVHLDVSVLDARSGPLLVLVEDAQLASVRVAALVDSLRFHERAS